MWAAFVDDFSNGPDVRASTTDPTLRRDYLAGWDAMRERIRAGHAKPALKTCLDLAVKLQFFDPKTEACALWLSRSYKSEHHLVNELTPSLLAGAPAAEPLPLRFDGSMLQSRRVH
jgi:hypothetical protein